MYKNRKGKKEKEKEKKESVIGGKTFGPFYVHMDHGNSPAPAWLQRFEFIYFFLIKKKDY